MKVFFVTIIAALCLVSAVYAADRSMKFAVDGGGGAPCKAFLESEQSNSPTSVAFAGWIDGYFSAFNQFNQDTYDVTPWQSGSLLRAMLKQYCRKNPDRLFGEAVATLGAALRRDRLDAMSELVKAENGKEGVAIYRTVLQRAQQALNKAGYYKGKADGTFDAPTQDAFRKFQTDRKLEATGLPDQRTLYVLFYQPAEGAAPSHP